MSLCTIDSIMITKLDDIIKVGTEISIKEQLDIPVKLIGVGEGIEALQKFKLEEFVEALFKINPYYYLINIKNIRAVK
ncbi:hypothetical protein FDG09_00110 [Clostridium sporogenes]|nr:hypothetical protein [Clostridium sporogenes]